MAFLVKGEPPTIDHVFSLERSAVDGIDVVVEYGGEKYRVVRVTADGKLCRPGGIQSLPGFAVSEGKVEMS